MIIMTVMFSFMLISCDNMKPDADRNQRAQTQELLAEADRQVGMPNIVNFQERKLAKMILELRDQEDFLTYAYIVNLNGDLIYLGRAIGYGLPYSVQYTNPQRPHRLYAGGNWTTLPQADPNGLFMPDGLSATWLMLVDPSTNEARPVYVEPEILVSPFQLH